MKAADNSVDEAALANVISQSTGIPVTTMLGDNEKVVFKKKKMRVIVGPILFILIYA